MSPRFGRRQGAVRIPGLLLIAWIGLAGLIAPVHAQDARGSVMVRVTERSTGEPISDVMVRVQGTDVSQVTNASGQALLLNVPVGTRVITLDRLGFSAAQDTVNVTAGGTATVAIAIAEAAIALEGVVVTGTAMGAQRREIGNSISVVTSEEIEKIGAANFEDLLRGRALGVSVTGSPGSPGAGSDLALRGITSVNGRNQPLIYLDGIRIPSGMPEASQSEAAENASFLGGINPADIERIEVIKGPAAATLYGTEATAGVIQIFTKKGQPGRPR